MNRRRDWQSRLAEMLDERARMPFEWGRNDCMTFAAAAVEAITGKNPAADLAYTGQRQARVLVRRLGGMRAAAASRLGDEITSQAAQPGDIGLILSDGKECFAVCTGEQWHAPARDGWSIVPLDCAVTAWRVC